MSGEEAVLRLENERLRAAACALHARVEAQAAVVEAADRLALVLAHGDRFDRDLHAEALAKALRACPGTRAARWAEARAKQAGG